MENGVRDIDAGKVAAIVTHLEMRNAPPTAPVSLPDGLAFRHVRAPDLDWYKRLYRMIGANWLWFSRLTIPPDALVRILNDPGVEVYALSRDGTDLGLMELDFRCPKSCELAFLGITSDLIGTGAGRYLMHQATTQAWAREIDRFHVHTCTLDHPGALSFYQKAGFIPVRQQVEIADDPRLMGLLPDTAAPHVPLLRPVGRVTGA